MKVVLRNGIVSGVFSTQDKADEHAWKIRGKVENFTLNVGNMRECRTNTLGIVTDDLIGYNFLFDNRQDNWQNNWCYAHGKIGIRVKVDSLDEASAIVRVGFKKIIAGHIALRRIDQLKFNNTPTMTFGAYNVNLQLGGVVKIVILKDDFSVQLTLAEEKDWFYGPEATVGYIRVRNNIQAVKIAQEKYASQ